MVEALIAAANAAGASSGEKCPVPGMSVRVWSAKKSPSRSAHSRGKSGSCSGQRMRVGWAIRSSGAGVVSARLLGDPGAQPVDRRHRFEGAHAETMEGVAGHLQGELELAEHRFVRPALTENRQLSQAVGPHDDGKPRPSLASLLDDTPGG